MNNYLEAKNIINMLPEDDFKQENLIRKVWEIDNKRLQKALLDEGFNQKIIAGYKYKEMFNVLELTAEFQGEIVRNNWLDF